MFRPHPAERRRPDPVVATLGVGSAILGVAGLSFLGLGAQPPTPEWGVIISDGRDKLRTAWWISTFAGVAIMISVLAINLLGDALRDVARSAAAVALRAPHRDRGCSAWRIGSTYVS